MKRLQINLNHKYQDLSKDRGQITEEIPLQIQQCTSHRWQRKSYGSLNWLKVIIFLVAIHYNVLVVSSRNLTDQLNFRDSYTADTDYIFKRQDQYFGKIYPRRNDKQQDKTYNLESFSSGKLLDEIKPNNPQIQRMQLLKEELQQAITLLEESNSVKSIYTPLPIHKRKRVYGQSLANTIIVVVVMLIAFILILIFKKNEAAREKDKEHMTQSLVSDKYKYTEGQSIFQKCGNDKQEMSKLLSLSPNSQDYQLNLPSRERRSTRFLKRSPEIEKCRKSDLNDNLTQSSYYQKFQSPQKIPCFQPGRAESYLNPAQQKQYQNKFKPINFTVRSITTNSKQINQNQHQRRKDGSPDGPRINIQRPVKRQSTTTPQKENKTQNLPSTVDPVRKSNYTDKLRLVHQNTEALQLKVGQLEKLSKIESNIHLVGIDTVKREKYDSSPKQPPRNQNSYKPCNNIKQTNKS